MKHLPQAKEKSQEEHKERNLKGNPFSGWQRDLESQAEKIARTLHYADLALGNKPAKKPVRTKRRSVLK